LLSRLRVVGISHRSVRTDQLAQLIPESVQAERLQADIALDGTPAVLLVTCNRVEVAWLGESPQPERVFRAWLSARSDALSEPLHASAVVRHDGPQAVRHLIRVTAGLESQLQGDSDILGQVREAWGNARRLGFTSTDLDRVFERVVHATRRVRRHAEFDDASRTIGRAAADALAERAPRPWSDARVLVLGSGAAATSALDALQSFTPGSLSVSSRTDARARDVAQRRPNVHFVPWGDRHAAIARADVVVFALRTDQPVVGEDSVHALLAAAERRVVWADLGMPPNVHANVRHSALELLPLGALMTWRAVEQACAQRAEAALERECAMIGTHFARRRAHMADGLAVA
jgi:glutamyl-tRNA reductase